MTDELRPGDAFGPYRIEARIGAGGMGTVYRAAHRDRGAAFALKVLRRALGADPTYRQRFLQEARAATTVAHPHLVPVVDSGEIGDLPFLAMPLIDGAPLDRMIKHGPLTAAQAIRLVSEIGGALDALHGAELMHRDIKPANILVSPDGGSALTDFGLAKGTFGYRTLTVGGAVVGTLAYLAPERIRGEPATPASDIYALGCTVFECLTGSAPFTGVAEPVVVRGHLQEEPPNPSGQRPGLDEAFGAAVIVPLQKDPAARPQSATAYARLLESAAAGR
jgi:serine/threonine-protein kinase